MMGRHQPSPTQRANARLKVTAWLLAAAAITKVCIRVHEMFNR